MLTPFLFELRALMDWIWTDSSMPLFEWLKMEDIFANIYELKVNFREFSPITFPLYNFTFSNSVHVKWKKIYQHHVVLPKVPLSNT